MSNATRCLDTKPFVCSFWVSREDLFSPIEMLIWSCNSSQVKHGLPGVVAVLSLVAEPCFRKVPPRHRRLSPTNLSLSLSLSPSDLMLACVCVIRLFIDAGSLSLSQYICCCRWLRCTTRRRSNVSSQTPEPGSSRR